MFFEKLMKENNPEQYESKASVRQSVFLPDLLCSAGEQEKLKFKRTPSGHGI